tara:strand:- start:772 stop:1701 length:930 start_codon:yes stop_codon:yes gene_type:complete
MTARAPLRLTDSNNNLIEMTSTEITAQLNHAMNLYAGSPSVTLSKVSGSGTLASMTDTRTAAGAVSNNASAFVAEGSTQEPQTVTVTYDLISETRANTSATSDTNNIAFPVWNNSGNIQAMTYAEMEETFFTPAVNLLADGSDRPGTFRIHTATSLSGNTLTSSDAIFLDTRANVGAYAAAGIPETVDQPTTVTSYYLFSTDAASAVTHKIPFYIDNTNKNINQYTQAEWNAILLAGIRHTASEISGVKLSYNINGSGNNKGSGMVNTKLNGAGNYQTLQVGDDYRSQEFPNGSAATIATHRLKLDQIS